MAPAPAPSERKDDDVRQQRQIRFFTLSLFAVALLVTALVWSFPIWFGTLGSMVVAYFAFGAILALANAIELAIAFASERPIIKRWFGDWAIPRALGACVIALAIVFGVANAWLHPFHRVRLCDGDCKPGMSPDQRPTVRRAARAWYQQAEAAYQQAGGKGPVPMVIVATAGGGIRAAYWTATVLERLAGDFERGGGSMRPYLFAISGVSGGSVGAADFEAALTQRDENHCKPDKPGDTAGKRGDKACPLATDFLEEDFLAPALASLVFRDAPSSFLPDLGQGDRGTALERGFEQASNDLLARPFLDLISYTEAAIANGGQPPPWRPILLLNATHEETGNRIIASQVLIERNVFVDSLDALQMLGQDVRASTAAHNSARFTYVSPAGDLGSNGGSVIDGGYFENFGALSAMELAHAATAALNDPSKPPKVKLIVLMISSDPDLNKNHMLVRINQSESKHPGKCLVSIAEREPVSGGKAGAGQRPGGRRIISRLIRAGSKTRSSTNSSRHFRVWRRCARPMETGPRRNSPSRFAPSATAGRRRRKPPPPTAFPGSRPKSKSPPSAIVPPTLSPTSRRNRSTPSFTPTVRISLIWRCARTL